MRRQTKLNYILQQLNHPDLDNILLVVEQSKPTVVPSKEEVEGLIFNSLINVKDLSQQHKFHQFSRKIQNRVTDIVNQIQKIQRYNRIAAKPEVEADIQRILNKTQLNAGRQQCLSKVMDHLQIPDIMVKKIVDPSTPINNQFFEAVDHLQKQKLLIVTLQSFGNSRLVDSIKKSHQSLVNLAITKAMKSFPKLYQITDFIILRQYKKLLQHPEENKRKFQQAILNSRKEISKNHFSPIISQLNYTLKKPIQQYYAEIFEQVIKKFGEQRLFLQELFPESKSKLLSQLTTNFVLDVYFKLERCFFKAMDPLPLCKIRAEYLNYYKELRTLLGTEQYKSIHLQASLAKLDQCIQSVIKTQGQKMTKNKYNIYSVAGYMGIADTLKALFQAYVIDESNTRWIQPFYRLAQSRLPTELNKSLVIFSLNIWQIYLQVFGDQKEAQFQGVNLFSKAQDMIKKGTQMFLNMNKKQFNDKILKGNNQVPTDQKKALQFILLFCSSDPKKILHAELSLIIHQNIKTTIKNQLNQFLIDYYEKILTIIQPMNNEQLKVKCLSIQINIKTLGRAADTVYVPTLQEMKSILQ